MALQTIRIGSLPGFQYDDGDFDSAVETNQPIKAGLPSDPNDVVRLTDLAALISALTALSAPTGLETVPTLSEDLGIISITGSHRLWIYGTLFVKPSATVDLSALADGVWYIYYDATGTLQRSQTVWNILTTAQVAIVYKNGANYFIFDERHRTIMDAATHNYLHYTRGTAWASGLVAAPTDTTLNLGSGEFEDEDLRFQVTGANPYQVRIFYRDIALNWVWTALQNNWWKAGGTGRPQWDNAGTLADLASGRYGVYFLVAINGYDTKIITFMGQGEYTTLAQARAALYGGMSFGTLPTPEIKALYKIIVRATPASGTFEEVQDLRANPQLVGSAPVLTDHGTLGGLNDPDHPASAITNTPAGTVAATNVQAAIDELDTEKTTLADVKADADIADALSKRHNRLHAMSSTSDHSDVDLAALANDDLMQWDDPSSKWEPKSIAEIISGQSIAPGPVTISSVEDWRYAASIADDGTKELPTIKANYAAIGNIVISSSGVIDESAEFEIDSTGTCQIIRGTANVVVNADTDTKVCLGTAAAQNPLIVKNRLGGARNLMITIMYVKA